jgi:hypothetical protein
MLTLAGYTTIIGKQMNTNQIPIEQTLDPGEAVVPASAVDVMTSILALGGASDDPAPSVSSDTSIATLVIGAIVIYFIIKLILRFLPWILGLGLMIAVLTML